MTGLIQSTPNTIEHGFSEPKAYELVAICSSEPLAPWNRLEIKAYSKAPLIQPIKKRHLSDAEIQEMLDGTANLEYAASDVRHQIAQVFYTKPSKVAFKVEEVSPKLLKELIERYTNTITDFDQKSRRLTVPAFIEAFDYYREQRRTVDGKLYMRHTSVYRNRGDDKVGLPFVLTPSGEAVEYTYLHGTKYQGTYGASCEAYLHSSKSYKSIDELAKELERMRTNGELKVVRVRPA